MSLSATRGRVIPTQMKKLLDLLSEDGVLVNGKVMYTHTTKQSFWKRVATELNSVDGGVYKNTWKWCKMWVDWKAKTKKKANLLLKYKQNSSEQHIAPLTNLELRLLKLIKYPVDHLSTQWFQITLTKKDLSDNAEEEIMFFENEDIGDHKEDDSGQNDLTNGTQFYGASLPNDNIKEMSKNSSDSDTTSNNERFSAKRRLQALKKVVPKARVQRSEELRLKAIELRLKGEELRLKEMEMNKISYLTNIEEEKLKCFKDISASLKELVELSRNGSIRFNNAV